VLGVTYHRMKDGREEGEEQIDCFSGFVLVVSDSWFYVTAGHILEGLNERVERREIRINKCRLADYFGPTPTLREAVPFDLEGAEKWFLHRPDLGLDFALIHLRPFFRDSLTSNKVIPMNEANWSGGADEQHIGFAMVGIPSQLSVPTPQSADEIGLDLAPTLIWIRRPSALPENMIPPAPEWFVGQVNVGIDIKGMSGAPIFGFSRTEPGDFSYRVVAVQSYWYPGPQIILGCPVRTFMALVQEKVEGKDGDPPDTR
jgi:hypothetical protein